jgi:NTP pyrophosphatase (non-canonical NTP hydrolase)
MRGRKRATMSDEKFKVYVASSWKRTARHGEVVRAIREVEGVEVFDYRNPPPGPTGVVPWTEETPWWVDHTPPPFPGPPPGGMRAKALYTDARALREADAVVLVLDAGKSAHLEAGFALGAGIPLLIFGSPEDEAELMYGLTPFQTVSLGVLQATLRGIVSEHRETVHLKRGLHSYSEAIAPYEPRVPALQDALALFGMGLSGEAGEVTDLLKKVLFHGHELTDEMRRKLVREMGDVLWYLQYGANRLGVTLLDVARENLRKLQARYPEGFDPERSRNRTE